MEELPSEKADDVDVDMDDSDDESLASTIQADHDSEEEWIVSSIMAAWKVDGSWRYLIEWEGFDLSEATWEPRQNLNRNLIEEWKETKAKPGFDLYQRIGDWKKAWKDAYDKKLARHRERNRRRKRRGLKQHSFEHMELLLEWVDRFPDGEDLGASTESSPSSADYDSEAEVGQYQPSSPEEGKTAGANLSDDRSSNSSRRDSALLTTKAPLPQPNIITSSASHTQLPPRRPSIGSAANKISNSRPTPTNSLQSKFGRPGLTKRTDARSGKVPLTARKTQTAQVFTGNVFAGGKQRKQRQTLAEVAKDSTKKPKFLKPRYARIVEKAGRDRDGVAPPKMPSNLISLNPAERNVETPSIPSIEADRTENSSSDRATLAHHHDDSSGAGQKSQKKNPGRSISWGTVEKTTFREPEEFAREGSSLFMREETLPTEAPWVVKEEWALDALPLKDSPANPAFQPKTINSRANASNSQICGNDYVSTDSRDANPSNRTIITDVQFGPGTQETISVRFERFEPQNELPWPAIFENMPSLIFTHTCMTQDFSLYENELAADKLGNGIMVSNDNTTSLMVVANWLRARSLGALLYRNDLCIFVCTQSQEQTATTVESPPLYYYLFRPAPGFTTRSLSPINLPEGLDIGDVLPQMSLTLFDRLLGFRYEQLEDPAKLASQHNFFLAFPGNTSDEAQLLSLWLRACNSDCRILSSFSPGHWQSLLQLDSGVVIIHEEAIWSIRLFPGVKNLLQLPEKFNFMLFSKSLQPSALYPSLEQRCRVGDVSLQPLCGQNMTAILITPSFVISQPRQLWRLVKWFWEKYNEFDCLTLVVGAGFDSWLLEVATAIETNYSGSADRDEYTDKVTRELEALQKTRDLVQTIQDQSCEEQSRVILGPELIDSNDEQSLVNWFGWWSIMNLDQYRKFAVVGSSATDGELTHLTTRPKFAASTVADVQELEQPNAIQEKLPELQRRFRLIPDDTSSSFQQYLDDLDKKIWKEGFRPQILCPYPVAYWNQAMASELDVYPHNNFETYKDCFRPFRNVHFPRHYNTAVALCYTIEGSWSLGEARGDMERKRRPWIMIIRPADPHRKPYKSLELIIWDPVGRGSNKGEGVYEGDLIEAQRIMIQAVQEEFGRTLPLRRVWYGEWDGDHSSSIDPVDRTLHRLEEIMLNVKAHIPANATQLEFKGWKIVRRGDVPDRRSRCSSPEPMDIDAPMDALKIVFHPPRAKRLNGKIECKNHFFQHCMEEKRKGSEGLMRYRFKPTMEWYKRQAEAGRGFEHIDFMPWKDFFAKCNMDSEKG
ncbi:uncharacterized protein B0J16DRAFT_195316 [Fusarium flagelliforme]|uniref:uncharacterized protein n=1 Tax=Fusarium flagelliforme TaxID=2675880 RepID=UPI001E8D5803|nr:uncharacterized protein B0J16DRAFT_195316 [Fusarium flagelliforme]KAH7173679.1 hypothetical protein B0J16DRAFT_195316 [Fusarium flagelliforme]